LAAGGCGAGFAAGGFPGAGFSGSGAGAGACASRIVERSPANALPDMTAPARIVLVISSRCSDFIIDVLGGGSRDVADGPFFFLAHDVRERTFKS
jgi:hypothetical protein